MPKPATTTSASASTGFQFTQRPGDRPFRGATSRTVARLARRHADTHTAATRPPTAGRGGRCRSGTWAEVESTSSRLTADIGPGARCSESYSCISGSASTPTTLAIARM